MIDRKELKATAKARMRQASPGCWTVMLLYLLVAALVPALLQNLTSAPMEALEKLEQLTAEGIDVWFALQALQLSAGQVTTAFALNVVLTVFQWVMAFGLTAYFLRLYRGEPCGPSDLAYGFSMVGRVLGQRLLVLLIMLGIALLLTIPITMVAFFAAVLGDILGSLVMTAAMVGIFVLFFLIILNYVLASLALADQPELGAMGSIQYGKNLIRGHRGEYFILILSFFGWSLLCSLPTSILSLLSTLPYALSATFNSADILSILPAWFLSLSAGLSALPSWVPTLISVVLSLPIYLWLTPYMETTIAGFYDKLRGENAWPELPPL